MANGRWKYAALRPIQGESVARLAPEPGNPAAENGGQERVLRVKDQAAIGTANERDEPRFGRFARNIRSSHDQVAQILGHEILSGVIAPGEKLPQEAEILARFGISRTVL